MSTLHNLYCIPQTAGSVEWDWLLLQLLADDCIRGPWTTGLSHDLETQAELSWDAPSLFAPETNPIFVDLHPHSGWAPASDHIEALTALGARKDVVLCGTANEEKYRRAPDLHYKRPCEFGLYRFSKGHRLELDTGQHWSPQELLWLHGENAPLIEDFTDSPFHRALAVMWPGVTVIADEWL